MARSIRLDALPAVGQPATFTLAANPGYREMDVTGTHIGHGLAVHPDPFDRWPWSVSDMLTGYWISFGQTADDAESAAWSRIVAQARWWDRCPDGVVNVSAILRRARQAVNHG